MSLGFRIKAAREKAGLTQAELANEIPVHRYSVSKWERETTHPGKPSDYVAIARTCNVSLAWLKEDQGSVGDPFVSPVKGDQHQSMQHFINDVPLQWPNSTFSALASISLLAIDQDPEIDADRLALVLEMGFSMIVRGQMPDVDLIAMILRNARRMTK